MCGRAGRLRRQRWWRFDAAVSTPERDLRGARDLRHRDGHVVQRQPRAARRADTGCPTLWSYSFAGLADPSVNPPAVGNGTVYVAAGRSASTALFALDAASGSVKSRSPMSSQAEDYLAPTIGPTGNVHTNAGSFGGLYAFDGQLNPL